MQVSSIVVFTFNILGILFNPFEFSGDYGPEINPIRETVWELLLPEESRARSLSKDEVFILNAIEADRARGPILSDVISPKILKELAVQQQSLSSFSETELQSIQNFVEKFGSQKHFRFLHSAPKEMLSLEKTLNDTAAAKGTVPNLPNIGSMVQLKSHDAEQLKSNLVDALFTEETFSLACPRGKVENALYSFNKNRLQDLLGEDATHADLLFLASPTGQVFLTFLYYATDLQIIAEHELIEQVNRAKAVFAQTLGNPQKKAEMVAATLLAQDAGVLFTQEADAHTTRALTESGAFHKVEQQIQGDGTHVFLRSDLWEPDYEIIPVEGYQGGRKGALNLILATQTEDGSRYLLAAGHGNSTQPEDGRKQIAIVKEAYESLVQEPQNKGLQLIIGIDANTKTAEDVEKLHQHFNALGLVGTSVGITTVKQRMMTMQHTKAFRMATDEEDFLIVLKPENGGCFALDKPTVGFSKLSPDPLRMLPDLQNPSDHYPVGATLRERP
jgi:hypothetical protein